MLLPGTAVPLAVADGGSAPVQALMRKVTRVLDPEIEAKGWEKIRSTVEVDQAQVESAQGALETAQLNLEYCSIHSPIQGRAGARLVDVGNVVQANTTALLLIQRLDPIYADFTITERDLPNVQR